MAKSYKYSRSRKPLGLKTCQLRMVDAIKAVEKIILTEKDDNTTIQAANCMSGLISRYTKLYEARELEKRIEALEQKQQNHKMRAVK